MMQFPFKFQDSSTFLREDFIVSAANETVYSFLEQWPNWGEHRFARILYMYGPEGCGKTHLAHLWQQQSDAKFIDKTLFATDEETVFLPAAHYVLDDVEALLQNEEALLHFLNTILENNSFLLITARSPASQLTLSLADLASRMRALPSLSVTSPDDALLHAILVKHFSDRQLRIEPEVVHYLLSRVERSFSAVKSLVEYIDSHALAEKRNITIPFVRSLISHQH